MKVDLPQLAVLEVWGGAQRKVLITQRRWRHPMGRLQVKVLDGGTGTLTAARILGLAPDGRFYAPSDAYSRIGFYTGTDYFHTSGKFTMEAPPGRMTLEAVKGFEYQPAHCEVEIHSGQDYNCHSDPQPIGQPAGEGLVQRFHPRPYELWR